MLVIVDMNGSRVSLRARSISDVPRCETKQRVALKSGMTITVPRANVVEVKP